MTVLGLTIVTNVALIVPGLLLLQPMRLWNVLKAERQAITPRQRFRGEFSWGTHTVRVIEFSSLLIAVYPRTYNPSFALSACILSIMFAATFSLIFPIITPVVVLLLLLGLAGESPGRHD